MFRNLWTEKVSFSRELSGTFRTTIEGDIVVFLKQQQKNFQPRMHLLKGWQSLNITCHLVCNTVRYSGHN